MAIGRRRADATTLRAACRELGSPTNGICSIPFLDHAFRTAQYRITVTVNDDGTLVATTRTRCCKIARPREPFHHTDRNTLRKVAEPTPNWLMRKG